MNVHDELVHLPNTEVVLGQLRGLQQTVREGLYMASSLLEASS